MTRSVSPMTFAGLNDGGDERGGNSLNVAANLTISSITPYIAGKPLPRNDRNLRAIGEIDNRIAFEEQGLAGFDRDYAQVSLCSDADGFDPNYWHIETHVLIRLGDFDHDRAFTRERAAALDGLVRSFERFHRKRGSVFHDHRLPNVESRDFFRDLPPHIDIFRF